VYTRGVLKLLVLTCAAVWIIGLFLGRRRRVIKNSTHLLQLILWLALVFLGSSYLPRAAFFEQHLLARGLALVAWIMATYPVSILVARLLENQRRP